MTEPTMIFRLTEAQRAAVSDALDIAFEGYEEGDHSPEVIASLALFDQPGPTNDMPRYDPRFNEIDQQSMWEGALEEAGDLSTKDIAQLVMDSWDLVSCIAACTVIDGEHSCEPLAEMLQRIDNKGEEEYITGEFLREHDDGDGYPALLDFAKRMGLIDEAEENITDLGREYMESLL